MEALQDFCLVGKWSLKKKGSDYVPGIADIVGVPFCSKIMSDEDTLIIDQLTGIAEEIHICHMVKKQANHVYYQIGKMNMEHVSKESVIISVVVHVASDFKEFSVLRMGPCKGQRSLEQFKLSDDGYEVRVEIDHVFPDGDTLKLVKRFIRLPDTDLQDPYYFHKARVASNWIRSENHSASTLRSARVAILDVVDYTTPTEQEARDSSKTIPSLTQSEQSRLATTPRRLNGEYPHGQTFQVFVIQVTLGENHWNVQYRYREFDAFHQFLSLELRDSGLENIPDFPRKTIGRATGKSLEQRKEALQNYLAFMVRGGGFGRQNIVDGLCSFLEIPEHTHTSMEVPQAQTLLRSQMLSGGRGADAGDDVYPKHILLANLSRWGKPQERILKCNQTLTKLIITDDIDDLTYAKEIQIKDIRDVYRGCDVDPMKPTHCGTATLRRHCAPAKYAYCICIVLDKRTIDLEFLSKDEHLSVYINLKKYLAANNIEEIA